MEVYALVGASGTGKSHKAVLVANERKVDTIIDDGLLIKNGKKLAGVSAKGELTIIKAVKRAIFLDKDHALEVKTKIKECKSDKILILGTSDKMITKITRALDLPDVEETIYIEDISTELEISKAQKMRNEFGKHVIPVPVIEVKKDLPNLFMDSLKYFFVKRGQKKEAERTIIRPKFSMLGKLIISEHVIEQLIKEAVNRIEGLDSILRSKVSINDEGVSILTEVKVTFGLNMRDTIRNFQKEVINLVENLAGLNVLKIDVNIKSIAMKK